MIQRQNCFLALIRKVFELIFFQPFPQQISPDSSAMLLIRPIYVCCHCQLWTIPSLTIGIFLYFMIGWGGKSVLSLSISSATPHSLLPLRVPILFLCCLSTSPYIQTPIPPPAPSYLLVPKFPAWFFPILDLFSVVHWTDFYLCPLLLLPLPLQSLL